jgi:hypothetical protein
VISARAATEEDAETVARLLTEFRDHQGRDWPDDASFLESVRRLMADPDTEFLLAGEPLTGCASCATGSGSGTRRMTA